MSISINTGSAAGLANVGSDDKVGMAVLKKAIEADASTVTQLVGNLPTPAPAASRGPVGSLGHNIDTHA
ncbi:putative motility protein [Derxia gummosa]|uniref:Motility protein n=1 Tax=Derxia gummosa DSM 723 TaxID=1121388 RepID=A0A8B6X140_9BURK|nr:putative motility protein [Derxia gummosa]